MSIYKLSLGKQHFNDKDFIFLKNQNLVCVHPDTGKGEGPAFVKAQKGEVFYACRSNDTIEFLGMFIDAMPLYSSITEKATEGWLDREYIILFDAKNKSNFNKEFNKKMMPRFQSTFTLISKKDIDSFEKEILKPVFEITIIELKKKQEDVLNNTIKDIEYYAKLQEHYSALLGDKSKLFNEVNDLNNIELKKLEYSYLKRGDISNHPVVLLRYRLLQSLIEGEEITNQLITQVKIEVDQNFEKNVFQAWSSPFRILYSFLYEKEKDGLVDFFCQLIWSIQEELKIKDKTKINLVHLDGAQNQGNDEVWFAIYNKTYKTQNFAKQLFFKLKDGFEYGLIDVQNRSLSDLIKLDTFDFEDIVQTFSKHIKTIINDNSMEKAKIGEYIEVLEHKKQIILQGPPGTGKTYNAKKIAKQFIGENKPEQIKIVQFHPSYSYEDFVRGITAKNNNGKLEYKTENKILAQFAKNASETDVPYVLIIDEINRANLPVVLGELIYALEYRGEAVETMYSVESDNGNKITIPENLYIIGTMNTADRSVGHIDYAIKRRFAFVDVLPTEAPIINKKAKELFKLVSQLFVNEVEGKKENSEYLAPDFNCKDVQLGHSYFILREGTEEEQLSELSMRLQYEIMPILHEYVKDGLLLENDRLNLKLGEIEKFGL